MKTVLILLLVFVLVVVSVNGYVYPLVGFHGLGREGGDEAPGYRPVMIGRQPMIGRF